VDRRTRNHINGIEGFWSYAKHILYNYRGVSKYHFPVYQKEIEYRSTTGGRTSSRASSGSIWVTFRPNYPEF
jgi:transposase-like protein